MADLILVVAETGMNVDFTIIDDETGTFLDLNPFDVITLKITPTDFTAAVTTAVLSIVDALNGKTRWAVDGDIPATAGVYYMQITLLDTGVKTRKTRLMDLVVEQNLV